MKTQWLLASVLAALAATVSAPPSAAPNTAQEEGLVAVKVPTLDEFLLRPAVDFAGYRKVLVEPARVEMQKGWLKSINAQREPSRWLKPEDQQNIVEVAAASMTKAVAAAFKSQGFEIVTAPGPGVLRLAPSTSDLFLNAPDVTTPTSQISIIHDEAGTATLNLEMRDGSTGTLVGRVADRNTAREVSRFSRATSVSNLFWFDAMFSAWARNCAKELQTAGTAP